jgi:hypothetical protein
MVSPIERCSIVITITKLRNRSMYFLEELVGNNSNVSLRK